MILYNIVMIINFIYQVLTSIIMTIFLIYLIARMHDDRKLEAHNENMGQA